MLYQSSSVGEFKGREAALDMMAGFFPRFSDVSWAVEEYRVADDHAVDFEFVLSATDSEAGEFLERLGLERIEFCADGTISRIVVGER